MNPESKEQPNINFRRAELEDSSKILELQRKVSSPYAFRGLENDAEALQDITDDIAKINVCMIESKGELIGVAGYQRQNETAFISSFLIDPKYQGQGLGSASFDTLLNELQDLKKIEIDTGENNQNMRSLLDRSGFVKESDYKLDNGETILHLVRHRP